MEWFALYLLPGFALVLWGWEDACDIRGDAGAFVAALVGVVLTWPIGVVVRARNVRRRRLFSRSYRAASADTHPKDGDAQQAPLVSGAVPKADAQPPIPLRKGT